MDRSYPYTRRLERRTQLNKRLAALAALGVAGCAILYATMAPGPIPAPAATQLALATAGAAALPATVAGEASKPGQRRVYPYSIVPGGVSGPQELGRVIREDKVVAAHYAEFDMAKAHEKTVTTPRAVHVSYRKGDKVYWTAKKVMLAEGETLVSDGTIEARARCANQISDTPRLPVEAHGPSAEELDAAVVEDGTAADVGLENLSMSMADGEGAPVVFLNATGSGNSGGVLAGGGAIEGGSLFAAAANVPGSSRGAFLSSRSSSTRGAPAKGSEESAGGGSGGSGGSDSGGSGSNGGGDTPATSNPATGSPGSSTPGSSNPGSSNPGGSTPGTPSTSTPEPATPQPSTPDPTPGSGGSPSTPGTTPGTPSQPGVTAPTTPGGSQTGGGESGIPSLPPTEIGGNPAPGSPGSSPDPEPTLNPPKEPVPTEQQPAKPVEVPEPGSLWLVAPALALLVLQRRRKRRA